MSCSHTFEVYDAMSTIGICVVILVIFEAPRVHGLGFVKGLGLQGVAGSTAEVYSGSFQKSGA